MSSQSSRPLRIAVAEETWDRYGSLAFMDENGVSKLNHMTTAEIAAAVDARKYWRGLHHRILCIARTGAFTWFLFQNLLYFRINLLFIIAITAFALIVELRTNRFTMTTYSTSEIVDLLMKRTSLEMIRTQIFKLLAVGSLLWLASVGACFAGAPALVCYTGLFFGAALLLWAMKFYDLIKNENSNFFHYARSDQGRFHVRIRRSWKSDLLVVREHPVLSLAMISLIYAGLALAAFFAVVFFLLGGSDIPHDGQQMMFFLSVLFSAFGCGAHEPARFHLVQREMDRLSEKLTPNPN